MTPFRPIAAALAEELRAEKYDTQAVDELLRVLKTRKPCTCVTTGSWPAFGREGAVCAVCEAISAVEIGR